MDCISQEPTVLTITAEFPAGFFPTLTQLPFTTIRMAGLLTATIHIAQHPPWRIQRRLKLSACSWKIGSPSSFLMSTFLSTPLFSFPNWRLPRSALAVMVPVTQEGTYGWALSLEDGTRLAHGAGYVNGHDPLSFRAEGRGMLSVVCFIRRLLQWTCTDSVLEGVLATDNTGLIARSTSQSELQYSIPNATFKSNWDIVESIVQTVWASRIHITLEDVRGHQDNTTQAKELDLLAQLNVEADKYAGDFRFRQGEYRPIIPLMPTCSVSLNIDGKTVHRNFKTTIREAIHGTALLKEM
jgi:hypothetical protein